MGTLASWCGRIAAVVLASGGHVAKGLAYVAAYREEAIVSEPDPGAHVLNTKFVFAHRTDHQIPVDDLDPSGHIDSWSVWSSPCYSVGVVQSA